MSYTNVYSALLSLNVGFIHKAVLLNGWRVLAPALVGLQFATQACCTALQTRKLKAFTVSVSVGSNGSMAAVLIPGLLSLLMTAAAADYPALFPAVLNYMSEVNQYSAQEPRLVLLSPSMFLLRHILILYREKIVMVKQERNADKSQM